MQGFSYENPSTRWGPLEGRPSIGESDSRLGSQTRGHNSGGGDQWWRPGAVRTARGDDSGAIATSGGELTEKPSGPLLSLIVMSH
jgi:hypothetical protein